MGGSFFKMVRSVAEASNGLPLSSHKENSEELKVFNLLGWLFYFLGLLSAFLSIFGFIQIDCYLSIKYLSICYKYQIYQFHLYAWTTTKCTLLSSINSPCKSITTNYLKSSLLYSLSAFSFYSAGFPMKKDSRICWKS